MNNVYSSMLPEPRPPWFICQQKWNSLGLLLKLQILYPHQCSLISLYVAPFFYLPFYCIDNLASVQVLLYQAIFKKLCDSKIFVLVESNKCLTASINSFTYKLHSLGHVLYILTSWYQGYQCFFQRKCKLESVPLTNLSYGLTSETSEIFFSFF